MEGVGVCEFRQEELIEFHISLLLLCFLTLLNSLQHT